MFKNTGLRIKTGAEFNMTVSMLIFGTVSLPVKYVGLPSSGVAFYRAAVAIVGLVIFKLIKRDGFFGGVNKKTAFLLMMSGAAMGFNWIFLFEAYKYTSVATATLCYYFAPVIVTLLCPFIFKERATVMQMICFAASTLGLVLITLSGGGAQGDIRGILPGIFAAILYASVMLFNKGIQGISGIDRTLGQFIFAAAVVFPYALCTGGLSLSGIGVKGYVLLAVLGIGYTCIPYVMYLSAVAALPGRLTALLGYIDPLVACVLSVALFGEPMGVTQAVGGVLILGSTLADSMLPSGRALPFQDRKNQTSPHR